MIPWLWIIGILFVVVLCLAAMFRGGGKEARS